MTRQERIAAAIAACESAVDALRELAPAPDGADKERLRHLHQVLWSLDALAQRQGDPAWLREDRGADDDIGEDLGALDDFP